MGNAGLTAIRMNLAGIRIGIKAQRPSRLASGFSSRDMFILLLRNA